MCRGPIGGRNQSASSSCTWTRPTAVRSLSESRLRACATPTCRWSTAPGYGRCRSCSVMKPLESSSRSATASTGSRSVSESCWCSFRVAASARRARPTVGRRANRAARPTRPAHCSVAVSGSAGAAARCTTTSASRVSRPMSSSTGPAWFRCRTRCRPPSLPYSGARCSPVGVRYSTSVIRSPASRSPSSASGASVWQRCSPL
ncbi:Uncharacterised protein [Mycobacterium tuberculosis]|nr:Uncharacterised protein [Mycobacterium tuberculosis]